MQFEIGNLQNLRRLMRHLDFLTKKERHMAHTISIHYWAIPEKENKQGD